MPDHLVYLDHNATSPLYSGVLEAMTSTLAQTYGNPSSVHTPGQAARAGVDQARRRVSALMGGTDGDLVFTGSGTEAVFLGVVGAANGVPSKGHLVVSGIEHTAGMDAARFLQDTGWEISRVAPDSAGRIDPADIATSLKENTVLVSVLHANNETGVIQPIEEVAALCRQRGILFHTDAVQSVGKIPVQAAQWGVDLVSIAAHKMGGPKGVGALWKRAGVTLKPVIPGTQEGGLRGGTQNTASIVGFGAAADLAQASLTSDATTLSDLQHHLEIQLTERLPSADITGRGVARLPNTTHMTFSPGVGEDLVLALDLEGFAVSSGSACTSGSEEPSHVLLAMGLSPERARTAIRVSLGPGNTRDQLDAFVDTLARMVTFRESRIGAGT